MRKKLFKILTIVILLLQIVLAFSAFAAQTPLNQSEQDLKPETNHRLRWAPEFKLSLIQPLQIGTEAYWAPSLRFFGDLGYVKFPIPNKQTTVDLFNVQAGARWFPFASWLFFYGSFGYRNFNISTDVSSFKVEDETIASSGTINLPAFYFAPGMGMIFELSESLSIGFDLGLQLPLISSGTLSFNDAATGENSNNSDQLKVNSGNAMGRISGLILPELTLCRLSWRLK